jgi:putative membrane protein
MMWQYGNGMGTWGPILMTAANLLFWALVVVGVIVLVRSLRRAPADRPRAEELLAERFARGEIGEQEYRERLDVLRAHVST